MSTSKKGGLIIGVIIAIAVIAIGTFVFSQNSKKELETKEITVTLDSKNKAQDSSSVVVIFKDDKGKDVYATAVRLDAKTAKVNVPSTVKKIKTIPAVNSDGSIEKQAKEPTVKDDTFTVTLKTVPKEKVSVKDYEKIIKDVTEAAKVGDSTLSKDNVKNVLGIVNTNIQNNDKLDKKDVKTLEKKTDKAKTESVDNAKKNENAESKEEAKPSQSSSSSSASSTKPAAKPSSTNSSSSSKTPAKKEKKWVPEKGHYETKTTTTYETKAVTGEGHYEQKLVRTKYICRDGFTTYDLDELNAHRMEVRKNCNDISGICVEAGYVSHYEYEDVWVPGETTYQKVPVTKTTKVWVVDVPGHYE